MLESNREVRMDFDYIFISIVPVIFILAGIFNWEVVLNFGSRSDAMRELLGPILYRAFFVMVGICFLGWIISLMFQ